MTRIYLDTSAVAKLFLTEAETPDLRKWLITQPRRTLVSSALLPVELIRLLRLLNPVAVPTAESFLATSVDIVEITPPVLDSATHVKPPKLRALDSIHLATALDLGDTIDVMLTYDKVLIEAARAAGFTVACPGAE